MVCTNNNVPLPARFETDNAKLLIIKSNFFNEKLLIATISVLPTNSL